MGKKTQRLKTLRSLYVNIFNKTRVGFLLVDKEGIIKDVNKTFCQLFSYPLKSELRDKNVKILHISSKNYKKFQKLSHLIFDGEKVKEHEFELLSSQGESIWCAISGTLLTKDDRMKEGGILWDIVDIREKVKTRKLISKQNAELKKLNQYLHKKVELGVLKLKSQDQILVQKAKLAMMGEMMDAVAHQWKQPLSVIKLAADELSYLPKDNQQYLEETKQRISTQVDYLVETLYEFRDFFRPKTTIESINIKNVIDSSLVLLKDELIHHMLKIEFSGDMEVEARLIPNEFKHIIINLINNARDQYLLQNISKRIIYINIASDENFAYVKVTDQAGGIPKEYLKKIFEANFTTKEEAVGSGIGLYMSKNILEKIEATISAKNVENGAQFQIRIPL